MHPERGEDAAAKGESDRERHALQKGDTQLRETDVVAVEGRPLAYQKFVYIMLNKPEGVVSASTDKRDTTVVDLLGDTYPRRNCSRPGGWTRPAPVSSC